MEIGLRRFKERFLFIGQAVLNHFVQQKLKALRRLLAADSGLIEFLAGDVQLSRLNSSHLNESRMPSSA